MDPSQYIAPILGIVAAAAITFYAVSFQQMSQKSFEDAGLENFDRPQLRSTMSAKERRKLKQVRKEKKGSSEEI
ncbi:hypothetical protein KP509_05G063700 [Ceratopteris richardii]|uniref:Uncharacterized protein n=1 Tax=Ceratopteris richardii TaxID=49495 RepID=A0A8T2UZ02_CERRI|nr:hypothetical protein KP509_05G063700 [Ceratopteris richardii]